MLDWRTGKAALLSIFQRLKMRLPRWIGAQARPVRVGPASPLAVLGDRMQLLPCESARLPTATATFCCLACVPAACPRPAAAPTPTTPKPLSPAPKSDWRMLRRCGPDVERHCAEANRSAGDHSVTGGLDGGEALPPWSAAAIPGVPCAACRVQRTRSARSSGRRPACRERRVPPLALPALAPSGPDAGHAAPAPSSPAGVFTCLVDHHAKLEAGCAAAVSRAAHAALAFYKPVGAGHAEC